jgi:hypothetical protein
VAGCGIIYMSTILHDRTIHISFSIAPFGICLFTAIIAYMSSSKKKDFFFLMDNDKVEYRYGLFKPTKFTHKWDDVIEIMMPHKEKKVQLKYKDNTEYVINLTWIEKKKSHHIKKHFYYAAREKNINLIRVDALPRK